MPQKFYITTSIMYANSKPHVGFALELFQADFIARLQRLLGKDVFFLTGSDENGLKNYRTALANNQPPQEYVDKTSQLIKSFADTHQVSIDDFIRTTDQKRHWPAAQKLWSILAQKKLLSKKKYGGWYCVGCESFKKESDLDEKGFCPDHQKKPEWIEEENYFFPLSQYSDILYKKISAAELKVYPEARKNEILTVLKQGLQDISFSRPKSSLSWGIPVPGDDSQVMYVWCDALTNYISAIGYSDNPEKFNKLWPADVHLIGKDIIRFHAAIWPAMLLAADLPLPKIIFTHGHILSGGQKMSKSVGNVIDPVEITDKYGISSLRLILLKEIPAFSDGDITLDRIKEIYNSELANKLGNLISRVFAMHQKYFAGKISDHQFNQEIGITIPDISQFDVSATNFGRHDLWLQNIWSMVEIANKYVDEQKPWELAKSENNTKLETVLLNLLETIRLIALLLEPIAPETSQKILINFDQEYLDSSQNYFEDSNKYQKLLTWGNLKTNTVIQSISPLFPRID